MTLVNTDHTSAPPPPSTSPLELFCSSLYASLEVLIHEIDPSGHLPDTLFHVVSGQFQEITSVLHAYYQTEYRDTVMQYAPPRLPFLEEECPTEEYGPFGRSCLPPQKN